MEIGKVKDLMKKFFFSFIFLPPLKVLNNTRVEASPGPT